MHARHELPRSVLTLGLLRTALVAGIVTLTLSCATAGRGGESGPAPPDVPVESSVAGQLDGDARPLRYPRLLDDPETIAAQAAEEANREAGEASDGNSSVGPEAGTSGTGRPRPLLSDPIIEELLDSLSLRQRIGQRFIAPIQGDRITYGAGRSMAEVAPAGFIVYPWNFDTAADLKRLTNSLQQFSRSVTPGIDLLICADQEGGRVATLRLSEFFRMPSAAAVGRLGADAVEASAYLNGMQMRSYGINMNLAPVLDVYGTADDSIIGDRSFSGDPQVVAELVEPYLRGAGRSGIISVAKHFPGHGITSVDSHAELPVVETTLDDIRSRDLIPFRTAISSGIDVIMTAHILYENIDPFYPATLSRLFLRDLLRGELGFDGVIMSDGLEMGAIRNNFDLTETLIRLFRNDVDLILLFVNYDVVELVDMVEDLIRTGDLTEDDIDRGVRRVLRLKLKYGLAGLYRELM